LSRATASGTTTSVGAGSASAPVYVRITRVGDVFTAYKSSDGTTWNSCGSKTITMGSTVYIGLAQSSRGATVNTVTFDNVTANP